jgi:hypothetical protein
MNPLKNRRASLYENSHYRAVFSRFLGELLRVNDGELLLITRR